MISASFIGEKSDFGRAVATLSHTNVIVYNSDNLRYCVRKFTFYCCCQATKTTTTPIEYYWVIQNDYG